MPTGAVGNAERVGSGLLEFLRAFGFDRRLADTLAGRIAVGIRDRSLGQQADPRGRRWEPNAPRYARSPRKAGKPIGVLDGEMLSVEQLGGELDVQPFTLTIRYGRSDAVRARARWFQEGVRWAGGVRGNRKGKGRARVARRGWRQPPREFFALDERILADLEDVARRELEARGRQAAGGP